MHSNEIFEFNEAHRSYWEEPHKYALAKEKKNGKEYYIIYTIEPVLMMLLCEDFEYCLRLSKKMIESGVRLFNNFDEFYQWYTLENLRRRD